MKRIIITSVSLLLIIAMIGFFVPLGTYTSDNGCTIDPTPTQKLHLIRGESLEQMKKNDTPPSPTMGCSINTQYVLYLF